MDPVTRNNEKMANGPGNVPMSAAQWASVTHSVTEAGRKIINGAFLTLRGRSDTSDKIPQGIKGVLAAVAASVIYSVSGMSRWGLAEATLGLYNLHHRHVREGAVDTINGMLVTSGAEMQELVHWMIWADASYLENIYLCAQKLQVQADCIVKLVTKAAVGKPAYLVGLDHTKRAIVLSIRGTCSAGDVLTDFRMHSERFENGSAHSGMLNSAKWFRDNLSDTLKDLMAKHGYRLVVTGHSLGAGVGALLSMLLRETNEKGLTVLGSKPEMVTCWGFGCPPCVDQKLAEATTFIQSVVYQDDIVARLSPGALEDLRTEMLQTDWNHAPEDGSRGKKIMEVASKYTAPLVTELLEPALNLGKGEFKKQIKQQGFPAVKKFARQGWAKAREGEYGPRTKKVALFGNILALAAEPSVSTFFMKAARSIKEQKQLIEHHNSVHSLTSSSMAASSQALAVVEGKELLEKNRLYVPGVLYHVMRRPLHPREKSPDGRPVCSGTGIRVEKESPYRHIVVKGDDPSSRFQRIVLSRSLIADHFLSRLQDAVEDALRWQHSGSPFDFPSHIQPMYM